MGDIYAEGYVVYGIREKSGKRFGYVGQTGNFGKRVTAHAARAQKESRTRAASKWMHSVVSSGGVLEIVLLEYCRDEEHSLDAETKWIQKLSLAGHTLHNKWRHHQEVIASAKRKTSDLTND